MGIQDFLGKLNIKESVNKITEQIGATVNVSDDDINSYLEMVYGLFFSRGLKDGYREWPIDKERIVNYIEFHLGKPCNQIALLATLKCFDYNGYNFDFPDKGNKLEKLNKFKDSCNYTYSRGEAYSIATTRLKDLQEISELFNNVDARKYYVISYGLLSSTEGINFDGIKNYLESKLGEPCDIEILGKILDIFEQTKTSTYSSNSGVLYIFSKNAKVLYLNKRVFGSVNQDLDEANIYKCSQEDAYNICYPEIMENIKADYQKILKVVDAQGTADFETGLEKVISKYKDIIGEKNIKECIHIITKKWYFEDNKTVYKILVERMVWYLYKNMMKPNGMFNKSISGCYDVVNKQAAAITLRALNFEKCGGNQESYSSITKDACSEFISNSEHFKTAFEKEIAKKPFDTNMEELVESMANSVSSYDLFSSGYGGVWYLPSVKTEPYYTDSLCNDYWMVTVNDLQLEMSTDPDYIFDILFENLEPNERDRQMLEEENEKDKIRKQCRSCAFDDRCKLPSRALNCSCYCPK